MHAYLSFAGFFLVTLAAAAVGSIFMPGPWYETLAKPSWTPPNWLFPPAWTVLYILIAIAGWRVYSVQGFGPAVFVWGLNLAINAAWSYIMFGQHQIGLAAVDVTALWLTIVAFIVLAWPVDRTAALLFVPYLVWVTYAAALNFAIWRMNG